MGVHKQSVSFTDAAFNFARELVESGEYPNISAAVSGEMARARAARERERLLFEAEVQRRLALPQPAEFVPRLGHFGGRQFHHQFVGGGDIRMRGEELLDEGRAGTRHADDEDDFGSG